MYCSQCGKEIKVGARFCSACGCPVDLERAISKSPKQRWDEKPQNGTAYVSKEATKEFPSHADIAHEEKGGNASEIGPADGSGSEKPVDTPAELLGQPDAATQPQAVPQSDQRHKKIVRRIIGVVLFVGIIIGGLWGVREFQYRDAISSAESTLANRQFEEAIEHLDQALALRPSVAETYLMKATAYVEQGELYAAKQTLEEGFAATHDESLQNVSIWGPVPVVEMAMWANESVPLTRQEYYFSDLGAVQGYVNIYGNIFAVMTYYFDSSGNISGANLLTYLANLTGQTGINRTLWDSSDPLLWPGSDRWELNYNYNASGTLVSVNMLWCNGLKYLDETRITVEFSQNTNSYVILLDAEDAITIQYDATGRPIQIVFNDGAGYTISYKESGGYVTTSLDGGSWFESNADGFLTTFVGDDGNTFTLELDEQKRVAQILTNDGHFENVYSEDGYLEEIVQYDSQGEVSCSTLFTYDEESHLVEIKLSYDETESYRLMKYDQSGHLVQYTPQGFFRGEQLEMYGGIVYEYQQDGSLEYYIHTLAPDFKTIAKPIYDEYGIIVDFTSEQVE